MTELQSQGLEKVSFVERGSILSGTDVTSLGHIFIQGKLAPGNSPGCINADSLIFTSTAALEIEIGGATPCSEYDRVIVAEQLTLNGAVLKLKFLNGYSPDEGATFDILDWGTVTGSFGDFDISEAPLPDTLAWDFSAIATTGVINVIATPVEVSVPFPLASYLGLTALVLISAGFAIDRTIRVS